MHVSLFKTFLFRSLSFIKLQANTLLHFFESIFSYLL
ncbi:hypothetical protein NEOC65_000387 [Neochlamydia sp. AcF65]|nr:hypothetical protein [Neochlamydia sp. AcF65]